MDEAFHHHAPPEMTGLDAKTLEMLTGALTLHKTTVAEILTPTADLFTVNMQTVLTKDVR